MQFDKELFAANLRAARARLHISQRELARLAGVSTYSIAQYETGEGSEPLAGSVFSICVARHYAFPKDLPEMAGPFCLSAQDTTRRRGRTMPFRLSMAVPVSRSLSPKSPNK